MLQIGLTCSLHAILTPAVYGGTPHPQQTQVLRSGVDVIVGTPGRVLDHINFGSLRMNAIKFVCLDEADQMLEANGFQEEMWKVLQFVQDQKNGERDYQTLLFSATVPESVRETCARFLRKEYISVDLIGNSKNRTNGELSEGMVVISQVAWNGFFFLFFFSGDST